jgi:hypothetical protein
MATFIGLKLSGGSGGKQIFSEEKGVESAVVVARDRLFDEVSVAFVEQDGGLVVDSGFEKDDAATSFPEAGFGFA